MLLVELQRNGLVAEDVLARGEVARHGEGVDLVRLEQRVRGPLAALKGPLGGVGEVRGDQGLGGDLDKLQLRRVDGVARAIARSQVVDDRARVRPIVGPVAPVQADAGAGGDGDLVLGRFGADAADHIGTVESGTIVARRGEKIGAGRPAVARWG